MDCCSIWGRSAGKKGEEQLAVEGEKNRAAGFLHREERVAGRGWRQRLRGTAWCLYMVLYSKIWRFCAKS
jgi:hypothetical protein